MENRTNQTMTLKNGKKYVVINQIAYNNKKYYLANELTPDEEDITETILLLEESEKDGKAFVEIVTDPEIIEVIVGAIENQ